MKFIAFSLLVFSLNALAGNTLDCQVIEYHQEHEEVVLSGTAPVDLTTGMTYLELGSYKGVTFNATGINADGVLLYTKVGAVSTQSSVKSGGSVDVFVTDENPLTFQCIFR